MAARWWERQLAGIEDARSASCVLLLASADCTAVVPVLWKPGWNRIDPSGNGSGR